MQDKAVLLSVVVKVRPGSASLGDELTETLLSSIVAPGAEGAAVQALVVCDPSLPGFDDTDALKSLLAPYNGKARLCEVSELMPLLSASEYVMVANQGDCFEGDGFAKLVAALHPRDYGVVRVFIKDIETSGRAEFVSAYLKPFKGRLRLGGTVVKTKFVASADELFDQGLRTQAMLARAVMDSSGYLLMRGIVLTLSKTASAPAAAPYPEFADDLAAYSRERYEEVTEYVQFCIATAAFDLIDGQGDKATALRYLEQVEDDTIIDHYAYNLHAKLYALGLKHETDPVSLLQYADDGTASYNDAPLFKVNGSARLKICVTSFRDGNLLFEGTTDLEMLSPGCSLFVSGAKGKKYPLELSDCHTRDELGLDGELIFAGRQFKVSLPLKVGAKYEFVIRDAAGHEFSIAPDLLAHSRLDPKNPNRYFVKDGLLVRMKGTVFSISKHTAKARAKAEVKCLANLAQRGKLTAIAYRLAYFADRPFQRKPVWIVADRPHAAKDNGEHMYRYLLKQDAAKENDIYFMLDKSSPDYERVNGYGRVLVHDSLKHKIKFLESKMIISAAANNLATNAFGKNGACYRDLYDFDFVYLRHGVSHNDQSGWINKLSKNIRILVATCKPEYEGILNGDYGYTEREAKLTGLPRYDNLYDEREKVISILPTWRKNLQGEWVPRSSRRVYVPTFKETDYFKFYNGLINDERLLAAMEKHGYRGVFYLHPVFEAQSVDFSSSRLIEVGQGIADYQEVFRRSALMVTDYSSVAFDFAYLKKPVIYAQFDEETFYQNHSWGKGYFTYREDGFGPITTTLDETVDTLIEYIENGCEMHPEYVDKVDAFFAYTDRNNCQRVYEAIQEIERNA